MFSAQMYCYRGLGESSYVSAVDIFKNILPWFSVTFQGLLTNWTNTLLVIFENFKLKFVFPKK